MDGSKVRIITVDQVQKRRRCRLTSSSYKYINNSTAMNSSFQIRPTQSMGKGVFALKNITKNQCILEVDESQFITYNHLTEHPHLQKLQAFTDDKRAQFALFLSYQELVCSPESPQIQSYLQNLPKKYNNLICWTDEQLNWIKNGQLVTKIQKKKLRIAQLVEKMIKHLKIEELIEVSEQISVRSNQRQRSFLSLNCLESSRIDYNSLDKISLESILKYYAAIQSRSAYYQHGSDTKSQVGALIPNLQMFNHSNHQTQCYVQRTTNSYKIIACKLIYEGEQIFVNYGSRTFEDYLEFYGMLPECQPHNILVQKTNQMTSKDKKSIKLNDVDEQRYELAMAYNKLFR